RRCTGCFPASSATPPSAPRPPPANERRRLALDRLEQAALPEHRLRRRSAASEGAISLARLDRVARRIDEAGETARDRRVERIAGFDEGIEAVGVEHLGPEVDVVAGRVARAGEQMLEVDEAVGDADRRRQAEPLELCALEGDDVDRLARG